jgi:ATP-binding cassette subfamily B protein
MSPPPRATGLRSVLRYLPRYRGALIFGAATLVVGQLLVAYAPQLLRGALAALDRGAAGFDATTARAAATRFAIAYAAVVLVQGVLGFATRRAIVGASRRFESDLKRDAFDHLVGLPVPFFDRVRTGDLLSRLTSDVEAVRFSVGPGVMYLAQTAVKLPAALVAMVTMEWRLACLVLLPLAGIAVVVRRLSPAVLKGSRAVQDRLADLSSKAQENFAGARVVRAYALEEREKADFRGLNDRLVADTLGLARSRVFSGGLRLSGDLGLLAVVAYGGHLVTGRVTDVPTLVAFLFYLDMLVWPMISFGYVLASFQRASAAMGRLDELFATPKEPATTLPAATPPARWRGELELRHLSFTYPGAHRPALDDVSVRVPAGTTLAVVGPVGSGKSTLVGLLARLRDVPPGTVFLDGLDVDAVPVDALRAAFAYVPQDGFLFSASVRDNVAYGRATPPDDAAVRAALDAAGLASDLERMPEGMATVVGERGITLSGGQRQRVAIARALVTDAPVLVVDDALSAVDTRTEARILDGLRRARSGAPRSSRTASRPSATPTASSCSTTAASSRPGPTTSSSRRAAGTPAPGARSA